MTPTPEAVREAIAGIAPDMDTNDCAYTRNVLDAHLTALAAEVEGLRAKLAACEADARRGREIAAHFLPVMEAMRPLVLNLERLKDAAMQGESDG